MRPILPITLVLTACMTAAPAPSAAQTAESLEEQLKRLAATNPEAARALDDLAQWRDASTYSFDDFVKHVRVEVRQLELAPAGRYIVRTGMAGSASIGSGVGGVVDWIDRDAGRREMRSFFTKIRFTPDTGLEAVVTVTGADGQAHKTIHSFDNMNAVTVVLAEMPDGSRHVLQHVPVVVGKSRTLDFADHLPITLDGAILLYDGQFAGRFHTSGDIVGIMSSKAGMQFEFGLKPFSDAQPIGRTDGSTITFEWNDKPCVLINPRPFVTAPQGADSWKVYIRAQRKWLAGDGSFASSYGAELVQNLLQLNRAEMQKMFEAPDRDE